MSSSSASASCGQCNSPQWAKVRCCGRDNLGRTCGIPVLSHTCVFALKEGAGFQPRVVFYSYCDRHWKEAVAKHSGWSSRLSKCNNQIADHYALTQQQRNTMTKMELTNLFGMKMDRIADR